MRDTIETVGDDAAIVASILTSWDVPARLMSSPFGSDYYGERVRDHLEAWGVDVGGRLVEGFETPLEVAILDSDGGRTYFQRREPSALATLTPPSAAELSGAGLLYVDWYDGPSVAEAAATASSLGVPVYLNLESRYEDDSLSSDLLRHADICQVSMDEPDALGSPRDIARSLIERGVETVLVTMGGRGKPGGAGRPGLPRAVSRDDHRRLLRCGRGVLGGRDLRTAGGMAAGACRALCHVPTRG